MDQERFWVQIVCIIILWQWVKLANPTAGSFHKMFTSIPIGVHAGVGFLNLFHIYYSGLAATPFVTLSPLAKIIQIATLVAVCMVLFAAIDIVRRLIRKAQRTT